MLLLDVNVLVYAHREDATGHRSYRSWLEELVNSDAAFALSELVLSGFLRLVTHPRVFSVPTGLDSAVEAVERLRERPNSVAVSPGARHWDIFVRLCKRSGAKGNIVGDAYHAALATNPGASGSPPIGTLRVSPICAGATRSRAAETHFGPATGERHVARRDVVTEKACAPEWRNRQSEARTAAARRASMCYTC